MQQILLLPGDGIGPEVVAQAVRVMEKAAELHGIALSFETELIGGCAVDANGTPLSDEAVAKAKDSAAILLGAVGGPKWDGNPREQRPETGLLRIRKELGLFANLRPATVYPSMVEASALRPEIVAGVDMLVVRELTGGLYFGPAKTYEEDGLRKSYNTMLYDENEIRRIGRVAFEAARGRTKELCHVHKANVLEVSQLWLDVMNELAPEYPDVNLTHQLVDSCAMILVQKPKSFDVMVMSNLFGDIISDEAAMITGSLGMLPSASLGEGGMGLFEPVHGSAPDIAGQDKANPLATILSAAMLFEHSLQEQAAANSIRDAVSAVLDAGHRTGDIILPGQDITPVGCTAMGDLVLEALEKRA